MSEATAGALTETAPSGSGEAQQIAAKAYDDDTIWWYANPVFTVNP